MLRKIYQKISALVLLFLLVACQSMASYNQHLQQNISPEKLQEDVDFAYQKLQKLHPQLYNYIPQAQLTAKFDSLKLSLTQALPPNQFYQHLAPVISSVRQGHLRLQPLPIKHSAAENAKYLQYLAFLRKFKFHHWEDKIYITESRDSLYQIPSGAQLIGLNQYLVADELPKIKKNISADGFNKSFHQNGLTAYFFNYFFVDQPLKDTLSLQYICQDKIQKLDFSLKKTKTSNKTIAKIRPERDSSMDDIWDYNAQTSSYRRYFKYLDKDSSMAYLKISEFSGRSTKKFCEYLFQQLQDKGCQNLIIDLRNNPGGRENDVQTLYAYLSPKPYQLIKSYQLAGPNSIYHGSYLRNFKGFLGKTVGVITYPFFILGQYISVQEEDGDYYHQPPFIKLKKKNNPLFFDKKIYVLCNSGTFSAAGILAAQLKYDGLATIVGDETGAANDGTVAGFFSIETLPHSRLKLPIGLIAFNPNLQPDGLQAGIMPHHIIKPSLDDAINKKDRALDWVMGQCKGSD